MNTQRLDNNMLCDNQVGSLEKITPISEESSESDDVPVRCVRFGSIQVREFNRIVGDHPDVRIGVPVSIGWEYNECPSLLLDLYEEQRQPKKTLRLSSITRKNILKNVFEIPEEEIRDAEKEVQRIKKRRERSNKQRKILKRTERTIHSTRKIILRMLNSMGSTTTTGFTMGLVAPM